MGQDDNLHASLAHVVLCCVGGNGIGHMSSKSFTHPGMHANFLLHGVLGFLHYQSGLFNNDFGPAYTISLKATRYLAIPCLMADLRRNDQNISALHLISGLIPFALALGGADNVPLGNLSVAANLVALCVYAHETNKEWAWYTAGAGVLAYFAAPASGVKVVYPLTLAVMEYCAYRLFHIHFDSSAPPRR